VGGVMVLMGFLGRFIDSQINTQPWFTVALIVFGTIVSSYLAYKVGSRAVNKSQASYAKWREEQMAEKIDLE
jgi:F0F1-type ATP synthase assembly protein I